MIPITTPSGEVRLADLVDTTTKATIAGIERIFYITVDDIHLGVHEDDITSFANAEDVVDSTRRASAQTLMTSGDPNPPVKVPCRTRAVLYTNSVSWIAYHLRVFSGLSAAHREIIDPKRPVYRNPPSELR
ncbi:MULTISPECIES: hypothetical protein [Halomarina]|uniref:Uncharacterized protein n=2 Tax=Halomarina TaxID=871740 RepID=A0A6B0GFL0_9EURY|nr:MULTISPECIES: hypothetical protein [Halomarina]MWG33736.1 hypothetical protein [Halomarina oriensis]